MPRTQLRKVTSVSASCRLFAVAQSIIAVGLVARLHSFTTPPEEVTNAIHLGIRVGIIAAIILAALNLLLAVGALQSSILTTELSIALLVGITVLTGFDQICAPIDRQVGNWAIFGGLAVLNMALLGKARSCPRTTTPPQAPTAPATTGEGA